MLKSNPETFSFSDLFQFFYVVNETFLASNYTDRKLIKLILPVAVFT